MKQKLKRSTGRGPKRKLSEASRRQFLRRTARGTMVLTLWPVLSGVLSGCASDESKTISQTSDSTGDTHTVTLNCSDIETPPSGGTTVTSSSSNGHTHSVTFTETILAQIKSGETVQVTSASASGHTHVFAVSAC